eukprot:6185861-Pleurochrysis_carterae.AAC.6
MLPKLRGKTTRAAAPTSRSEHDAGAACYRREQPPCSRSPTVKHAQARGTYAVTPICQISRFDAFARVESY